LDEEASSLLGGMAAGDVGSAVVGAANAPNLAAMAAAALTLFSITSAMTASGGPGGGGGTEGGANGLYAKDENATSGSGGSAFDSYRGATAGGRSVLMLWSSLSSSSWRMGGMEGRAPADKARRRWKASSPVRFRSMVTGGSFTAPNPRELSSSSLDQRSWCSSYLPAR
jgi:hypothetical protein